MGIRRTCSVESDWPVRNQIEVEAADPDEVETLTFFMDRVSSNGRRVDGMHDLGSPQWYDDHILVS
jgi:hypothetical protein